LKVIDLKVTSRLKVENDIRQLCGGHPDEGKWAFLKEKGLSGLSFTDHQLKTEKAQFKSILALYKNGLGIYCRNIYSNKLVLLPETDVKSIEIIKNKDVLRPFKYSLFSIMNKIGISYETASKYLMPVEIVAQHPIQCIIRTENTYFTLNLEKLHSNTLIKTLNNTNFAEILAIKTEGPSIQYI